MKLCHITVLAFYFGDIPKGCKHGYDDGDLINAIEFYNDLLNQGFVEEPMDHFDLKLFINWANKKVSS